jgi:hypothetical protein
MSADDRELDLGEGTAPLPPCAPGLPNRAHPPLPPRSRSYTLSSPSMHTSHTSHAPHTPLVRARSLAVLLIAGLAASLVACDDGSGDDAGSQNQAAIAGAEGGSAGSSGSGGSAGSGGAAGGVVRADEGEPCGGPAGTLCGDTTFCDHGGTASCDEVGVCRARPDGCTLIADPEPSCGCDGQVYSARCVANLRGVGLSPGGVGCD